jgi:hypothetical protein
MADEAVMPWPPPERLPAEGGSYVQMNRSQITDEMAVDMTHVIRGAEYRWEPDS